MFKAFARDAAKTIVYESGQNRCQVLFGLDNWNNNQCACTSPSTVLGTTQKSYYSHCQDFLELHPESNLTGSDHFEQPSASM